MKTFLFTVLTLVGIPAIAALNGKPNFIVMQPDDLPFLEAWTPPSHFDNANMILDPDVTQIPNLQTLLSNGVQMMQAHTASPVCGTSRYSTITGRYPSRSSTAREEEFGRVVGRVNIPRTKLLDVSAVPNGNDCSLNNLAQTFKTNNYATGVVGKWHLYDGEFSGNSFDYAGVQGEIRSCGFDFAEAIYPENISGDWLQTYTSDGVIIDHNMYVSSEQKDKCFSH